MELNLKAFVNEMPEGWKIAFGDKLLKELEDAIDAERLTGYRVMQVKEKFGSLRWYDHGGNRETDAIIHKYKNLSARTCIICGKPAKYLSVGWIEPYCEDCFPRDNEFVPIVEDESCTE